jgi:hypothetical protein
MYPTRTQRALTALAYGRTRATRHRDANHPDKAERTWRGAVATACSWLDGTHPQIDKSTPG